MLAQLSRECFQLYEACCKQLEEGRIKRNSKGRRISAGTFNFLENRSDMEKQEVLRALLSGKKTLQEVKYEIIERKKKRKAELNVDDLRRPNILVCDT